MTPWGPIVKPGSKRKQPSVQPSFGQPGYVQQQGFGGQFTPIPGQAYRIFLTQQPNMVLNSSGNPTALFKAIIWQGSNAPNEKWTFLSDGQGNYGIVSAASGGTLEIPDYSNYEQGTQVHVSQPNGTINEKWRIDFCQGSYVIRAASRLNLVLNVFGGGCNAGDAVGIWPHEGGRKNELWSFTPC
jgi:hypothetical protein